MSQPAISIEGFAHELQEDLPRLIAEHPKGIYVSHLRSEYGESSQRILRVIGILEKKGKLTVHDAANNSHFITPVNYELKQATNPELTDLQSRTLNFIRKVCADQGTDSIATSYMQLARLLGCSTGGIHAAIHRLITAKYIHIQSKSVQGKQNTLVIVLGPG